MDNTLPTPAKRTYVHIPTRPSLWSAKRGWQWLLLIALCGSLWLAGVFADRAIINTGGWPQFAAFWQAAVRPVLSFEFLAITFDAMLVTLAYAAAGTFLSLLLGSILGILSSELWWESVWPARPLLRRIVWMAVRGFLAFPRGIHELIWGLFFLNIFGLDPLVAILAIAIPYGATVAKVFAEIIDEGEQRPYWALLNSGASPFTALFYGLIPLALADLLSYAFYRFECAIRAAAVLGVVGAGGLGYQILLSMQTLNYNETWTLFYALMLLSGLTDVWSGRVRQQLGRVDATGETAFGVGENKRPSRPDEGRSLGWSLMLVLFLVPFSFWYVSPKWALMWSERTAALWADMVARSWPLQVSWESVLHLSQLSLLTLAMSILAAVLASYGGAFLSFTAARNVLRGDHTRLKPVGMMFLMVARFLLLLMRAIPAPIWALVLLFAFFPGLLPGAIALGIYNLGILGRLMAEVVENLDERPSLALQTQGVGRVQRFFYAILPAATPRYTALSLYRWEVAMRATVVVGLVGAGGLGRELTQQLAAFNYRAVLVTLTFYIVLTFIVDLVSAAVRRSLK